MTSYFISEYPVSNSHKNECDYPINFLLKVEKIMK